MVTITLTPTTFQAMAIGIWVTSTPTTTLSLTQESDTYNSQTYLGLNVSNQPVTNNKISLAGQNLNTKPINLSGSLSIEANDATLDFSKIINVNANVEINKFVEGSWTDIKLLSYIYG